MLVLSILPEEMRVPLDKVESAGVVICEWPGVVAVVKPMDLLEMSRWNDAFPKETGRSEAATTLVFDQLIRMEGIVMEDENGNKVPFDANDIIHKRSLPMSMRTGIFLALKNRATLSEEQEKNSARRSGSAATNGTESSPAEDVASVSATN